MFLLTLLAVTDAGVRLAVLSFAPLRVTEIGPLGVATAEAAWLCSFRRRVSSVAHSTPYLADMTNTDGLHLA